jgi:hypothetical protein
MMNDSKASLTAQYLALPALSGAQRPTSSIRRQKTCTQYLSGDKLAEAKLKIDAPSCSSLYAKDDLHTHSL